MWGSGNLILSQKYIRVGTKLVERMCSNQFRIIRKVMTPWGYEGGEELEVGAGIDGGHLCCILCSAARLSSRSFFFSRSLRWSKVRASEVGEKAFILDRLFRANLTNGAFLTTHRFQT